METYNKPFDVLAERLGRENKRGKCAEQFTQKNKLNHCQEKWARTKRNTISTFARSPDNLVPCKPIMSDEHRTL